MSPIRGAVYLTVGFCALLIIAALLSLALGWAPSLPRVAGGS